MNLIIFDEDEKYVTLPEVKKRLLKEEKERGLPEDKHHIMEHADAFSFLSLEDTLKMVKELESIERINHFQAYKVVEIMPRSKEEIRAVFSKEIISLTSEEIDEILDVVKKFI